MIHTHHHYNDDDDGDEDDDDDEAGTDDCVAGGSDQLQHGICPSATGSLLISCLWYTGAHSPFTFIIFTILPFSLHATQRNIV